MQVVVVTGAAGLVGQNLIPRLKSQFRIVAVDKHAHNVGVLRKLHPDIEVIEADMAEAGNWEDRVTQADAVIALQAQIGGLDPEPFHRNNVLSTERLIAAAKRGERPYLVQVSSSVVRSAACDLYTESKKAQETLALKSGLEHVILRPTLMFGWFDRKHLGWLRRFMERTPVFPIPGSGDYLRQPLYAGDFAAIIASSLERRTQGIYNISGLERVTYVQMIRMIKQTVGAKTAIVHIPYAAFWTLLKVYSWFDKNPPFTTLQLQALVTPDVFEEIDWPALFDVQRTPLERALEETFLDPTYSHVALEF
ncbi:NAD-dependent epimerase/dehydratase family protein [Terricaulis silvestris]|uniref:dTDP-glucose 4,6-dehydratase n=1 Tax=Terricaulis silvestris TaxID=2686094 RepID=A0A6I6MVW2_9CAUL|nr:NAD(P)-dependent oxidoreductase [Terricaulis silvestris]QGZ96544.1 dTDP-glucose 4,6-dehydratase [Terricaulis silvestris]